MPQVQIFNKKDKLVYDSKLTELDLFISSSGELCLKTKRDRKYGIEKQDGTILIGHRYDDLSDLIKGQTISYYRAQIDGKLGFLKENGEELIKFSFEMNNSHDRFINGRIYLKKNGIIHAFDESGTELWTIKAERIGKFDAGLAAFVRNRYHGYIDLNGNECIECKYNEAYSFWPEGFAQVNYRGKWGIIDTAGNYVIEPQFDSFQPASDCEFDRSIRIRTPQIEKSYGIISPSLGKTICECRYKKVKPLSAEFIKVKEDKKWGLVDLFDKEILPLIYDEIIISTEQKKIFAKKGKKWLISDFVDPLNILYQADEYKTYGNVLVFKNKSRFHLHLESGVKELAVDHIVDIREQKIFYKKGTMSGVMDFNLDILLERDYETIKPAVSRMQDDEIQNYLFTELAGKFGVINYNGKVLLSPVYDTVWYLGGFIKYKTEKGYGYFNLRSNYDSSAQYERLDVTQIENSEYVICYSTDLDTIESKYFLHIDKDDENRLLIFALHKQIANDIYLLATGPIGGGLYGDVYARFHNVTHWDISEGYFTTDLSFGKWEYYYKGELCEKSDERLTDIDRDIFRRLSKEQLEDFIEFPDEDPEIPVLKEAVTKKLKKADFLSTGSGLYKNLSKHWGLKYAW